VEDGTQPRSNNCSRMRRTRGKTCIAMRGSAVCARARRLPRRLDAVAQGVAVGEPLDGAFGDRNLVCVCPPMEAYALAADDTSRVGPDGSSGGRSGPPTWRSTQPPRRGRAHGRASSAVRFDPPCLSLGRNEPTRTRPGRHRAAQAFDVVRRPTGAGPVAQHEVTTGGRRPIATFAACRGITKRSTRAFAAALHTPVSCGARTRPPATARESWLLLRGPVGGEGARGGAQARRSAQARRRAFLQHGSILLAGRKRCCDW